MSWQKDLSKIDLSEEVGVWVFLLEYRDDDSDFGFIIGDFDVVLLQKSLCIDISNVF